MNKVNIEYKIIEQENVRLWLEIMGRQIAEMTINIYSKNKIFYVSVSSSVLRNELLMCRSTLLKSLNKRVGAEVITNVMVR